MTKMRDYLGLKTKSKINSLKFKKIKTSLNNLQKESKITSKITKSWKINSHFKNSPILNVLFKIIHTPRILLPHQEIHLLILTPVIHPNNLTTDNSIHPVKYRVFTHKIYQQILNNMDWHQHQSYNKCKVLTTI